jgi:spermidine/putrescine-binding protein
MHRDMGLVTQVFQEGTLSQLKGHIAIGHTRYSTTGSSVLRNVQPMSCECDHGLVALAHNGDLINASEVRAEMQAEGVEFETTNDSEVMVKIIENSRNCTIEDAVAEVMKRVRGAYSVLVMTKDKLIGGEGALSILWSCDAGLVMQETDKIKFAIPKSGTNLWFDSAVVLKDAPNKENAEKFIDFLCRDDIALKNAEYLGSTSPVTNALNQLPDEIKNSPVLNPSEEVLSRCEVLSNLGEMASVYDEIWSDVLVASGK